MKVFYALFAISSIFGEIVPDRYIIKFKSSRADIYADSVNAVAQILSTEYRSENKIGHMYTEVFPGVAVKANQIVINRIKLLPEVNSVEHVYRVYSDAIQKNATWGISRVSQCGKLSYSPYDYHYDVNAGKGVNIYVVDTGVNINHADFEGRASWGFNTVNGSANDDIHGHGTHCAGTAASKTYGVAKKANIIAVKVLNDQGYGTTDDIYAGIEWIVKHDSRGKPKVISMSIGSLSPGDWLHGAAECAYVNGIVIVVSGGNSDDDSCKYTPAGAPNAITVAASDITDGKASFSNYGKCVDVIAPGVDILSTFRGSDTATAISSGTSMAFPHVAGIAATFLSQGTPFKDIDPKIKSTSTKDAITGFNQDTVNYLAYNNYRRY
jgi:cerevisin